MDIFFIGMFNSDFSRSHLMALQIGGSIDYPTETIT
jgi:hypothetical protein